MKYLSRVVWSEGMYLGPHHFQAQSRYFEDSIGFTTAALWFEPWGLVGAQLDAEALKNGTVSLIHARGIFDDGMVFHMPECDPLPDPRHIADLFPAVRDTVTIMLAVAPRRPEGANTMTSGEVTTLSQAGGQNGALRFRQNALNVLELDRSVPDVEALAQQIVDAAQDRVAFRWRHVVDQHVAAQRA